MKRRRFIKYGIISFIGLLSGCTSTILNESLVASKRLKQKTILQSLKFLNSSTSPNYDKLSFTVQENPTPKPKKFIFKPTETKSGESLNKTYTAEYMNEILEYNIVFPETITQGKLLIKHQDDSYSIVTLRLERNGEYSIEIETIRKKDSLKGTNSIFRNNNESKK